ncbi:hypothetical protein [Cylindrospermum sp. FACHB-282]|uniref:hypothetical protein n=1 Tax=Cylindrospermum sp. FACHB-282 TaxID=2692794 RepID=UPI0016872542|nr:hypothetical protein [Cylindrospermum sp. FACHB-282]MBD2386412.1 hypothetical protein [Cylindrospermum sp. FACHB-282]
MSAPKAEFFEQKAIASPLIPNLVGKDGIRMHSITIMAIKHFTVFTVLELTHYTN